MILDYETVKHAMQETSLRMLRSLPEEELVHRYDLITVRRGGGAIAHLTERRATVQDTALVGALQDRIDSRERRLTTRDEDIRRRDHIIAGQVESMRALPAGDG